MTPIRPRRSALYLPASNPRAIAKARTVSADVVILDLEDAVAPEMKETARAQALAALAEGGFGRREVVIRTNGTTSPWFEADLAAAARSGADAVLIPKVSAPETLVTIGTRLAGLGAPERLSVWAMVETALAILRADALAGVASEPVARLTCFVIGANDLAKETRARIVPGRAPMLPWLSTAVAAARAHGLAILDGVHNDFADLDGLTVEARQGRDMGFDGKTLSHPSQADIVNAMFSPTEDELAHARQIIAAFERPENRDKGAIAMNGWMVERLHAEMAQRVVALDAAIRDGAASQSP
jgi:citrate lyase subunit beta / citryl-CoA lyase